MQQPNRRSRGRGGAGGGGSGGGASTTTALVLCPTRELAVQTRDVFADLVSRLPPPSEVEGDDGGGGDRRGISVRAVYEDSFESYPNGIVLICHDAKPFIQVPVDALDEHRIVVVP